MSFYYEAEVCRSVYGTDHAKFSVENVTCLNVRMENTVNTENNK